MTISLNISVISNSRLSALGRACEIISKSKNIKINFFIFSEIPYNRLEIKKLKLENIRFICYEKYNFNQISKNLNFLKSKFCLLFINKIVPEIIHKLIKTINFHPSILPKFPGLNGFSESIKNLELGFTSHIVTSNVDNGEIINQFQILPFPKSSNIKVLKEKSSKLCSAMIITTIMNSEKYNNKNKEFFSSADDCLKEVTKKFIK